MPTPHQIAKRAGNEEQLDRMGYRHLDTTSCRYCLRKIAWYKTPRGRRIPLDYETLDSHFLSCEGSLRKAEQAAEKRSQRRPSLAFDEQS